jgi:hypothetical protein
MLKTKTIIILLIVALLAGYGGYAYNSYQTKRSDPNIKAEKEITATLAKVGALMNLPENERPALVTVVDKSKLNTEAFFSRVENGDQILVYGQSRKVIIYRPETNKIIEASIFTLPTPPKEIPQPTTKRK